MKRFKLFLFAVALLCTVCAHAQVKNASYDKGYAASVELGGTILNLGLMPDLMTSHGYCFGNGLYVGGGIGIEYGPLGKKTDNASVFLPLFADIKYSFLNRLASPFVSLKAGAMLDVSEIGIGYMVLPSVGVDIWRFSVSAGIQKYSCTYSIPKYYMNGDPDAVPSFSGLSKGAFGNIGVRIGIVYNF